MMHVRPPWQWSPRQRSREETIRANAPALLSDMKRHGMAMVRADGTRIDPEPMMRARIKSQEELDHQSMEELAYEERERD